MLSNLLILRPKVQLSIVMWLFNMFHVVSNNSSAWHGACAKSFLILSILQIQHAVRCGSKLLKIADRKLAMIAPIGVEFF